MRIRTYLVAMSLLIATSLQSQTANHVVISEVYGGGGNSGSTWKNDFVELYNPTNAPVNITGWSVQYASATGVFGNFKTFLSGVIQPKSFFLILESQGAGGTKDLPTPDVVGVLLMSGTAGKIALVKDTLTIAGPASASIVDFVGYGTTATLFEGSGPTPAPSNTSSVERKVSDASTAATLATGGSEEKGGNGWDTNNNAADFVAQTNINPQNSASPKEPPPAIQAGVGAASFIAPFAQAGNSVQLDLKLNGVSGAVITSLRFPKHALFDWSACSITANATAGLPVVAQTSDSVTVTGLSLSATDNVEVHILGLTSPDTTVRIAFRLETGAGSDSTALVTPLPAFVLYGTQRPIAAVKTNDAQGVPVNLQNPVTVHGIVTVAREFGGPAYIQDVSGGLAVFDLQFENSVQIGDEVTLTGTVTQYNGLTELSNVLLHAIHSSGNTVIPLVVTCGQLANDGIAGLEQYEGMLVQVNGVTVTDAQGQSIATWNVGSSGTNYLLHDADQVQVRIDADVTSIAGTPAPSAEFDIVGVVGQFIATSPFIGGYQLMPRSSADIISKGPIITVLPRESQISQGAFDLSWQTAKPGTSYVRYGISTSYELGILGSSTAGTSHTVSIQGLTPATVYHVQAFSVSNGDTSFAGDRVVSTMSSGSTGVINVYFNKSVNAALSTGTPAHGNADLPGLLVQRIDAAKFSIDAAVYSMSGIVGQSVAAALVRAWGRGVKVRVIVERDNLSAGTGTTFNQVLSPAGIPWIADDYDQVNGGAGLMHNKFFVFDARGGSSVQTWVWSGSWNLTDSGTNNDLQNAVEIQDQALANAYRLEFNEMWGSDSTTPNATYARFGARKADNTPHVFNVEGVPVELYFSPSDRTTSHINSTLGKAVSSIDFALLTFTRSDLASTLEAKKNAGIKVRGVVDNKTDTGSQFTSLVTAGVDVLLKGNTSGLFHHKYAVVDAELSTADQYVITGSHNWSSAAETSNNENTLIIESRSVANQYLQEFAARYKDAGGKDNLVVDVERDDANVPGSFGLSQNYPNPFNPATTIEFRIATAGSVTVNVYDVLGREVAQLVHGELRAGVYRVRWDAARMSSGVYYCELRAGDARAMQSLLLVK